LRCIRRDGLEVEAEPFQRLDEVILIGNEPNAFEPALRSTDMKHLDVGARIIERNGHRPPRGVDALDHEPTKIESLGMPATISNMEIENLESWWLRPERE
jgi:hypothetical protein